MKKITIISVLFFLSFGYAIMGNAEVLICKSNSCIDPGGIMIFTEGLTDDPIELEFDLPSGKSDIDFVIEITVLDLNLTILYTHVGADFYIQVPDLGLATGQYILKVSLNGASQTQVFMVN